MSRKAERKTAVAYLRTSSAANVGANKDSEKRQRDAITAFAKRAGYEIVDWFSDAAVSGEDEIGDRPGFSAMLDRIEGNGVRTVIVEDASRFARKVLTQELGIVALQTRGVTVWSARGEMNLAGLRGQGRHEEPVGELTPRPVLTLVQPLAPHHGCDMLRDV